MTLQKKILTGYGVAVALLGAVIVWAVGHIVAISQTSDAIIHENHRSILAAENMIEALERQESAVLMALFGTMDEGLQQFRVHEMAFLKWLTRAKDNVYIDGEADLLTAIDARYSDYIHNFSKFIELANNAGQSFEAKKQLYQQSITPVSDDIREKCVKLSDINEGVMYANNFRTNQMADRAVLSTTAVAAAGLLAVLLFSFILSRRITKPVRRLMTAAKQIADGNYAVSLPVETQDELGRLVTEFNQMAAKLDEYNKLNISRIIAEKQKGDAILKNMADGLMVFDRELCVTDINPAACAILGKSVEECLSRPYTEVLPDAQVTLRLHEIVETGRDSKTINEDDDIVMIGRGDENKHFSCSITPITDEAGQVTGTVLMLKDVTWLKELEQLKTEFVMAASHELRTPLSSMSMSLSLLLDNTSDRLDLQEHELLQGAHDELQRLKSLVNDLLDLSKIESGQIQMDLAPISIRHSIAHIQTAFQTHLQNKGVALDIKLSESLPQVRADADKLAWVLTNLVSNALRYVPDKKGRITIEAKRGGKFLHVSVTDNGPGIPEAYQSKIFEKFTQIEGYEPGGTGLGLAISREIVRAHGGTIWVESTEGSGSRFAFTLPIVQ